MTILRLFRALLLCCQVAALRRLHALTNARSYMLECERRIRRSFPRSTAQRTRLRSLPIVALLIATATSLQAGITTNNIPATQVTLPLAPVVFNAGNGNAISVSYADMGAIISLELAGGSGGILLQSVAGLTKQWGNNGSGFMNYKGTVTAINAALSHLTYYPPGDGNSGFIIMSTYDSTNTLDQDVIAVLVNNPPVLAAGETLASVDEGTLNPTGETIETLLGAEFSDANNNSFVGIAVVADASDAVTQGNWEYSTDAGTTWFDMGSVSTSAGLLLPSTAKIRFVPVVSFTGVAGALTVHAVENSVATIFTTGSTRSLFDTTTDAESSKVATAGVSISTSVSIVGQNDAPLGRSKTVSTNESKAYTFSAADFGFSDVDVGDTFGAVRIDSQPLLGSLTLYGNAVTATQVVATSDIPNLVFTPPAHANGARYASFTFSVADQNSAYDPVPNTLSANVTAVPAVITSVSVPANGTYGSGATMDFIVNFSEAVTVTGNPIVQLTLDYHDSAYAEYQSGSGTGALIFRYIVEDYHLDTDGIEVDSLSTNGGTLKDVFGDNATVTLNNIGSTAGVLVNGELPGVLSVAVPTSATYVVGSHLDFTINFSEDIAVDTTNGTPRVELTLGSGGTVYATYRSGTGSSALVFRYTVADGDNDADGLSIGALDLNGGTIMDTDDNPATLPLNSVASTVGVRVDAVSPSIVSVVRTTPSTQVIQTSSVVFTVTFSEAVTNVGTASFALVPVNGSTTTGTVASVTGGPTVYEVTALITGGAGDFRLDVGPVVAPFATGFYNSGALAFDQAGNLYVADQYWVKRVTAAGVVSTFASGFSLPHGVVFSPAGDLYVSNSNEVKKVTPNGVVTTFATGFSAAAGLAMDSAGNLYVGNYGNKTVSKVTAMGVVSTFATNIDAPFGLAFDGAGNLFVSSRDTKVISKIAPNGVVTGFVTGLDQPYQLQFDPAGDLFVADRLANRILRVKPDGTVSTYAANLPEATGLAFDAAGALYVSSHYGDNTVRKVSSPVSDLAGNEVVGLTYSSGETYIYDLNDAPTATNLSQSVSYTEDGGAIALADISVSDADASDMITATLTLSASAGGSLSVGTFGSSTSTFNAGTGVWTVTGTITDVNSALAAVTFTPAANYNANLTIATQIRDADNTGPANGSITLTGTPVNDAPVITNLNGDVRAYLEGGSLISTDTGAMAAIADVELDALVNYSGASITVARNGGANASDDFGFFAGSGVSLSGGNILKSGSSIATFVVTGGQLVITFTDVNGQTPTTFNANYIVRNIGYRNTSDNPPSSVTLNVTASDGALTSAIAAVTINITAVNDAPTGISLSSSSVNQSGGANAVVGTLSTADVDDSSFTYGLVSGTDSTDNALFNLSGANLRANESTTMAAGSYAIRVSATDASSAVVEKSFTLTVVDDLAPTAPTTPDLATASDTGTSSSDNVTNDTTPTFSGTAEANSTVELFRAGSTSLGSTTANGSGVWSVTVGTALSSGAYSITAKATDAANNTSLSSGSLSITIDDAGPAAPSTPDLADVSDTGTSDTDDVTNDTTPTFTGTAEANSTVELFRDVTTSLGSALVDGSGAWTLTVGTEMTAGTFSITAIGTDAAGTTSSASNALSVTIDTAAPSAPAISAISEDLGTSATDFITSDTTLIFSGTAEGDSFVTIFRNAVEVGMVLADANGVWSFDFTASALAEGTHTFTATAQDVAGNLSSASPELLVEIVIATITAPVITAISDDTGASSTDGFTNDTTLVINGTAAANQTITVARNGVGEIGATTANGAGAWSFDYSATALPEGVHLFNAIASDTAGNVSAVSADFAVTIDTTAPAIGTQPIGGNFTAGGSFNLGVSATDSSALTYQWKLGATALGDSSNRSGSSTATVSHSSIGTVGFAGDYTVVVTDLAGNATTSAPATVVVEKADQTISFSAVADQLTTSAPFAISATASTGFVVTFSVVSGPATVQGSTVTVTGAGTVTLRATQEGDLNYNSVSADRTFTVTSPGIPTSAPLITQQPVAQSSAPGSNVIFSVSATGNPSPAFQWRRGGVVIAGQTGSSLTLTNVAVSDSGATFDVVVSNSAGSVTSSSASLTVSPIAATDQVFFGPMGTDGRFALYIGSNRDAVFIGDLPGGAGSVVVKFTLDAAGAFQAAASNPTGTETVVGTKSAKHARVERVALVSTPTIGGRVVNGQLYFQIDGVGEMFGAAAQSGGSSSAVSGFYEAPVVNGEEGMTYLIVGTDGSVMMASINGTTTTSAAGTIDSSGQFSVQMDAGAVLQGAVGNDGTLTGQVVSNGVVLSSISGVSVVVPHTDRLVNISTRGSTGDNDKIIIAGFVISGSAPKDVLIRAIGPGLTVLGVTGAMENPVLTLYRGSQVIFSNDDWSSSTDATALASAAARLGASALALGGTDAALLATLEPGAYTAHITRAPGTLNGVALIELYDASANAGAETQRLINISSRGEVLTGEGILISGFVVTGNYPKKVLVRGVGPTLAQQGVSGVLTNPVLRIWKGSTQIAANDNWMTDDALAIDAAALQVGAFPLDNLSNDAAVLLTLAPGIYTAQVSGSGGATGIALVEVYEVP